MKLVYVAGPFRAPNPNEAKIAERAPADNLSNLKPPLSFRDLNDTAIIGGFVFGAILGFIYAYSLSAPSAL